MVNILGDEDLANAQKICAHDGKKLHILVYRKLRISHRHLHHSVSQKRHFGTFIREKLIGSKKRHPELGRECSRCKLLCNKTSLSRHLSRSCPAGIVDDSAMVEDLCKRSRQQALLKRYKHENCLEKVPVIVEQNVCEEDKNIPQLVTEKCNLAIKFTQNSMNIP